MTTATYHKRSFFLQLHQIESLMPKGLFYYLFALSFILPIFSNAQTEGMEILTYGERKEYEIGGITINGAVNRDRNAIKSIAGFREGDKITIPGVEIPRAIKALMKLKLFENVLILQDSVVNEKIVFLTINIIDKPILSRYFFSGIKKSQQDDLNDIVKNIISKEGIVTDDQKELAKLKVVEFYVEKGKLDAQVDVIETKDSARPNTIILEFAVKPNDRIKIEDIVFEGNNKVSDRKLRKKLKKTKRKGTLLKKTKFVEDDYEEDKKNLISFYNNQGFKNARIMSDSMYREKDGDLIIKLKIEEGNQFHFRNITWKGNSLYTAEQLNNVLGIGKGDVYNPELLENRLKFSQDGRDISSYYLDDGYLGFNVDPVEIAIENDSVDLEMRIFEGPQFTIENVIIKGNDRTNEDIVRRELRTRPGQKFSRSDIIRSQREIINLGYFNPEALDIQTPVNQSRGTVDIQYSVEERPSDQLELSAGYGGFSGLIGTLGVTFNNFSIANFKDRSTWSPLPQGDGQKLSVRVQSNSRFFKSYNFSFTEPWLGGKKPNSFTIGAVSSIFDNSSLGYGKLNITRFFAGIGTQLKWPDDFFSSSTTLNIETIGLERYFNSSFFVGNSSISDGNFKNFSIKHTLSRSSINDPLFPRSGSRISLSVQATLPYSLFRKTPVYNPTPADIEKIVQDLIEENGPAVPPTDSEIATKVEGVKNAKRYEWLEYHKWLFTSEWYFNIVDKLVFTANAKFGILGYYDKVLKAPPVERFEIGGDGLSNQNSSQLTGRSILALRGYETTDLPNNVEGGTIFNKFTLELRYPVSLNPNSTIYLTTFLQGGNSWTRFRDYNPFDVKRSAGMGLRVFLPMFGLLGFDYGFGFDKNLDPGSTWKDYGKFSVIIGFEPE
ncbi:MAG: BamA/TamA family outer membrane protein [Saprospiraceae bacterium]|nr:BamA/TamA family outer membrane protein [Saprospiraceae bacterium]